jgi:hypothetical protein
VHVAQVHPSGRRNGLFIGGEATALAICPRGLAAGVIRGGVACDPDADSVLIWVVDLDVVAVVVEVVVDPFRDEGTDAEFSALCIPTLSDKATGLISSISVGETGMSGKASTSIACDHCFSASAASCPSLSAAAFLTSSSTSADPCAQLLSSLRRLSVAYKSPSVSRRPPFSSIAIEC